MESIIVVWRLTRAENCCVDVQRELNLPAGIWTAGLTIESDEETGEPRLIEFGLELIHENGNWSGFVLNGAERIEIPEVMFEDDAGSIHFTHYDSRIAFNFDTEIDSLTGIWRKRRGPDEVVEMPFAAVRTQPAEPERAHESFVGRWNMDFESSDDPSVGIFSALEDGRVAGTFMTTTGDYRFLDGAVSDHKLVLCCFDGAHAFRFEAAMDGDDVMTGDYRSSNTWHETWSAVRNDAAELPDAFTQTVVADASGLSELSFPDLDGNPTPLNDPAFAGKARIIYVFGSWCPNCHDAAAYMAELQEEYGDRGLSIPGLAFELTGDHERDSLQVRRYLERHKTDYPVLIAGLADKVKASESFPVLDRIRSYPTTIFIDGKGEVRAVHTGFTGPATGPAYDELKSKFESLIEAMLEDA